MLEKLEISYENIDLSSYMTVLLPQEAGLIQYQVEMITSNEISHTLAVSKRIVNGDVILYYNITSKMPLRQILMRRKLKREELFQIVSGAAKAAKDAAAYQLSADKLVMNPDYIYVDPATCAPSFLYLPVMRAEEKGVKELLMDLIMQGQIELSNDNFVQVFLEALNSTPLSIERLEACMEQFRTGSVNREMPSASPMQFRNTGDRQLQPQPLFVQPQMSEIMWEGASAEGGQPSCGPQDAFVGEQASVPVPDDDRLRSPKKRMKKEKKQKEPQQGSAESIDGFDPEKAKKKFLLPQAFIMVAVAAMISFGVFMDASGNIVLNNILAVAIGLAVVEVILYREAYVNSKKEKPEKKEKGKQKQQEPKQPGRSAGGQKKPPVPSAQDMPLQQSMQPSAQDYGRMPVQPSAQDYGRMPVQPPTQDYGRMPVQIPAGGAENTLFKDAGGTDATEMWDGTGEGFGAFLEFYENGMVSRIALDKPSILVGRLSGQVDFAVTNPKVGKVHAEFIKQDGMFYVKDLNSKNGTYINGSGQRITSNLPYPLHDGDRIALSDSVFTIRCSGGR